MPQVTLTSNISSYQYGQILLLKVSNDFVPLTLIHVSMEQPQAITFLIQICSQLLAVSLFSDKDQH